MQTLRICKTIHQAGISSQCFNSQTTVKLFQSILHLCAESALRLYCSILAYLARPKSDHSIRLSDSCLHTPFDALHLRNLNRGSLWLLVLLVPWACIYRLQHTRQYWWKISASDRVRFAYGHALRSRLRCDHVCTIQSRRLKNDVNWWWRTSDDEHDCYDTFLLHTKLGGVLYREARHARLHRPWRCSFVPFDTFLHLCLLWINRALGNRDRASVYRQHQNRSCHYLLNVCVLFHVKRLQFSLKPMERKKQRTL